MPQQLSHQQLITIANEFGTPVYVYHAEKIAKQYQKLKDSFKKSDSKFFYACKSLTNINILKWMKQMGASTMQRIETSAIIAEGLRMKL